MKNRDMVAEQKPITVLFSVFAIACVLGFGCQLYLFRGLEFDDSYITYRYAQNLANGNGITWNPGEPPVEGYTNFLLVIILAPLIRLGVDPLSATRCLSIASAFVTVLIIARMAGTDKSRANQICLSLLIFGNVGLLCMVGLETVIFAAALSLTLFVAHQCVVDPRPARVVLLAFCGFVATLVRPEGALLVALCAFLLLKDKRKRHIYICVSAVLALSYLMWKQWHFGSIIPNAALIKNSSGWSSMGTASVKNFYLNNFDLFLLACFGFCSSRNNRISIIIAAYVFIFSIFYLRIDTLMNIGNRFLYPLVPLLFLLAVPQIIEIARRATLKNRPGKLYTGALVCLVAFFSIRVFFMVSPEFSHPGQSSPTALMTVESQLGKTLAEYPEMDQVTIAFADAGFIPYYSKAKIIDTVGLNDKFIARERDYERLANYLFSRNPEIIIAPVEDDGRGIKFGHGPLGNWDQLLSHPKMRSFRYVGTVRTDLYNLAFYVNVRAPQDLKDFVSTRVVQIFVDSPYEKSAR